MDVLISVVMPLFNKERWVIRAVASVLNQSYPTLELIVVDDGSKDDSVKRIQTVMDPRIRIISQENAGVSAARNRGIQEAKGELIAFLDADDAWKPHHLETIINLYRQYPAAGMWACAYTIVRPDNKTYDIHPRSLPDTLIDLQAYVAACVRYGSIAHTSSVVIRRSLLLDIGGFEVGITSGEDLDVWFQIIERSALAYSKTSTTYYYTDLPGSISVMFKQYQPSMLIRRLEAEIAAGNPTTRKPIIDYVAWRKLNRAYVAMLAGNKRLAWRLILSAGLCGSLRIRCLKRSLQSCLPATMLKRMARY